MIAEIYHAMYLFANENGALTALFVFSILSALVVYAFSLPISYYFRKKDRPLGLIGKSVLYFAIVLIAWMLILIVEGVSLTAFPSIIVPAIEGYVVFLLAALVYDEMLELNKKIPWMLAQLFIIWLVSLAIWYVLLYVVVVFGEYVFISL